MRAYRFILLVASVVTLLSTPFANSQNQTTVTSSFTTTSQGSITSVLTETKFQTSTLTSTVTEEFPTSTYSVLGRVPCYKSGWLLNATKGQILVGTIRSNHPVDFLLLSSESEKGLGLILDWIYSGGCELPHGLFNVTFLASNVTSYPIDVEVQASGFYNFIAMNRNPDIVKIIFDVGIVALSTQIRNATVYSTTYPMFSTTITGPTTQTSTIASPISGIEGFPLESILIGIAFGLLSLLYVRRRRSDR